jgi:hypothetical protein
MRCHSGWHRGHHTVLRPPSRPCRSRLPQRGHCPLGSSRWPVSQDGMSGTLPARTDCRSIDRVPLHSRPSSASSSSRVPRRGCRRACQRISSAQRLPRPASTFWSMRAGLSCRRVRVNRFRYVASATPSASGPSSPRMPSTSGCSRARWIPLSLRMSRYRSSPSSNPNTTRSCGCVSASCEHTAACRSCRSATAPRGTRRPWAAPAISRAATGTSSCVAATPPRTRPVRSNAAPAHRAPARWKSASVPLAPLRGGSLRHREVPAYRIGPVLLTPACRQVCARCLAACSTIRSQNAGRSAGLRLVTSAESTTTSSSTQVAPALRRSVRRLG